MIENTDAEQVERLNGKIIELLHEVERLQDAKRAALKIADERSIENVALRSQLASEQARSELFNARLSNEIDNCVLQEQRAEALREELKEAVADHDYDARRWAEEIKAAQEQLVNITKLYEAGKEAWRPVYETVLKERDTLRKQLVKAEEERDSLQQVFDLQWEAYQRAIKRWQEANPGNDLVWPDRADMVVWLMEKYALGEQK